MTSVFFVRHAQPDETWSNDRTKPLTALGLKERKEVTELISKIPIDVFFSSPFKRSVDTIAECAEMFKMDIHTDERFRERKVGKNGYTVELLEKRWNDFNFYEEDGESIGSVQSRNIEALNEVLALYNNKNIVIGTHGTALSAILNYYDSSFACEGFQSIRYCLPYVIRVDFEDKNYIDREELLSVKNFYNIVIRKATGNDLPDILDLYSQPDMDNGEILPLDKAEEIFAKMSTYPDYCVYVAEADGSKIVGTFTLAIMDNMAHMGSESGLIEDVVVSQEYQGKGIGTEMIKYALGICKTKSCYKVCLSSNVKRENAHKFYESLGFKIHGYSFLIELE
ncbi:MAG: bifunctional histidine phosphatase family protein/GNAT family N-acetyltransferase [Oscillospiraceae bacterium]|nr:bifunctional histidine phosphatase family protein/GNAT family N-acetyltransferase [Oscillospiraceae bacterium]